ncbi:hypothetical protein OIE68_01530 [Nocardia vinacea]|uniref:hypothetical protein n=1 Tax=Nocardia vinacea TaxID=96468 RepID=UPI002E10104D|nr:hypothetical protein OIE68_01530 [Nocardia vinacea]
MDTQAIVFEQMRILGSLSSTQQDLAELYELMRGGELDPPIHRITPEQIPQGLERLREGGSSGAPSTTTERRFNATGICQPYPIRGMARQR